MNKHNDLTFQIGLGILEYVKDDNGNIVRIYCSKGNKCNEMKHGYCEFKQCEHFRCLHVIGPTTNEGIELAKILDLRITSERDVGTNIAITLEAKD